MSLSGATDLVWYALAFAAAFLVAGYLTPLTIRVATSFRIQDVPDGRLKKHTAPTPYLGGLAVAAGFVIAFGLFSTTKTIDYRALGILLGGFMMLMLGLYDDLLDLRPGVKFLGQFLAAVVLCKAGVDIHVAHLLELPEWAVQAVDLALTILWITGITNAFNILDVMDGLAAGTAFIASAFLFVIALVVEATPVVPFMAVVLAGALLGFLRFNVHPARIFLGDTGSLFLGFMVGALAMLVAYSRKNEAGVLTPLVLLAVPIFETCFVAFHRARRGVPFFHGSSDHLALRLAHAGLPVAATVRRVWAAACWLGVLSLLLVFGPGWLVPWILGGVLVGVLAAGVRLSRLPPPPR